MKRMYYDSTAISQHFSNPDLFITFTFQKQSLPHVHLLIWLSTEHKLVDQRAIDTIISAEMPDPSIDPMRYETVSKFMMHGPCGASNPNCPCVENGRCKKNFPKSFTQETTFDEDGNVTYKRANTCITIDQGKAILDNRSVVPYNRRILVKYQAHMNIEVCHKGRLIKYLFKYITKGPDRPGLPLRSIISQSANKIMLTRWFKLNQRCHEARQYTYMQIPSFYVWVKNEKEWCTRRKGFAVDRLHYLHPGCTHTFYLRMLY
ncbi:hypothetical protein LINPERPRIM_LOCUS18650 [Linum perenne]